MPKESANLKLKLYNAITDAKELALDWFNNIFDYTNSNWVKIDDAYKEIKDKFDEYPTKDGTGATGDWDINAKSATNDSTGQQIDSTYVKNVESTDDGKLIVTKGNGDTSTADVSTPAGYNLVKTIPFAPSEDKPWLHIGDIKNTADNDVVRFTIKESVNVTMLSEDNQYTTETNIVLCEECIINDMFQKTDTDLSSSYACSSVSYITQKYNVTPLQASPPEANELESVSFFIVPTSGGNKTSCASVWAYIPTTENPAPDSTLSITISTEVTDKNLWEYVLTYEASAPKSDSIITPTEERIITGTDIASTSDVGIVKIGNNINVERDGTISVPKASATVPGVVKIGTGINVTDDGTINVESTPAGYVMTKEWSGIAPKNGGCCLKIGSISNLKFNDTIEISVAVRGNASYVIEPYVYNAIFSKGDDTSTTTYGNHSLLSYAVGNSAASVVSPYFAIDLYKSSSTGGEGAEGGETTDTVDEGGGSLGEDGTVSGDGTSSSRTTTSSYGDIFVNLSGLVVGKPTNFKAFITVKTSNANNFSYSLEQFDKSMFEISRNVMYDTKLISITQSGASKVNDFTFKAQTSDPGAGSSLATGTILFVYS